MAEQYPKLRLAERWLKLAQLAVEQQQKQPGLIVRH
jgi:hypothetical protein